MEGGMNTFTLRELFPGRRVQQIAGGRSAERKRKDMKKWFAVALALAMMVTFAAAADTEISVNGNGEVRISADTAVISLGVSARDRDVLEAQRRVNENIAAIRKALAEQGVPEENISTEFINIYAVYDYSGEQETLAAYNAGSTLAIRVTDMEKVGALIDAAFAAGANTLNGISFSAADTAEAEAEAMRKAVADAKRKAEVLAEASGLTLIGIDHVNEGGVYSYENSVGNVYARGLETASAKDAGTVVQAAKLIVSATVNIVFDAK